MKLRIIAGELGGRLIKAPDTHLTRPTTDRVRESLFNILHNRIDFAGTHVLDLYAGSGALGFECLSRGSGQVDFVELRNPTLLNLQENAKGLGVAAQCRFIRSEVLRYCMQPAGPYDLIFADPPFFEYDIYDAARGAMQNGLLLPEGIFIVERSVKTAERDQKEFGTEPVRKIGDACLYFIHADQD